MGQTNYNERTLSDIKAALNGETVKTKPTTEQIQRHLNILIKGTMAVAAAIDRDGEEFEGETEAISYRLNTLLDVLDYVQTPIRPGRAS